MTEGSLLSGTALANPGLGAVHAFVYSPGGEFHFAHALTNTLMLPYLMRYNILGCLDKFARMAAEAAMRVTRLLANNPRKMILEDAVAIYNSAY